MMIFLLNAVTNVVLRRGPSRSDGSYFWTRVAAVSEGLIELFTEPAETKDLPAACNAGD